MSIDLTQCTLADYIVLKAMMGDSTMQPDTVSQPVPIQTATPITNYKPILENWNDDLRANDLSQATRNSYEIHVKAFFAWHRNDNLHSVKVGDVIDYRDRLKKMNKRPATINLKRVSLNRFFQFCVDSKILESNPVDTLKKSKEEPLPPNTPSESDVNKMRNYIKLNCEKRNDFNQLLIFDLMKTLGMRVSETLALTFKDIDVDERVIVIRDSKDKTRTVPIPDELMKSYKQFASNLNRSSNKNQRLFMFRGKAYAESSVRAFYHRIRKLAGIKTRFSPHSLRHYFCKTQIESGTPITHVKKICGHSSIEVTAKYAEPDLDDLRVSISK